MEKRRYKAYHPMDFTNAEIEINIIQKLKEKGHKCISTSEDDKLISENDSVLIDCLDVDDGKVIVFFDSVIRVFFFQEEIMLIEEHARGGFETDETDGNMICEGDFEHQSRSDLLFLIYKLILFLLDAEKLIRIDEKPYSIDDGLYRRYTPQDYHVLVSGKETKSFRLYNITIEMKNRNKRWMIF